MNRSLISASAFALCVAGAPLAHAQGASASADGPVVQHSRAGIAYISGGAGTGNRALMAARRSEFPFEVVLSTSGGAYVVASTLTVRTPAGELLTVLDAGPIVMMKLPPGQYTLEATSQGKTERREVHVTDRQQTVEWRLPG